MYFKIIRVSVTGFHTVTFTQEPNRSLGWHKSIFCRYLVLPATKEEFKAYYRAQIPGNPPMRREEERVPATMTIDGHDTTGIMWYRPNRHQRKRNLSEIEAVMFHIAGEPVSFSQIRWG